MFTASNLYAQLIFGSIGTGIFIYGKKQSDLKALLIGIGLVGIPYLIPNTFFLCLAGVILVAALFFPR